MTPEIWVEVDERHELDEIRASGIASAYLTSNPRLYGRRGDRIYLTGPAATSAWGNRDPNRFGVVVPNGAPLPSRAGSVVVTTTDPTQVQDRVDLILLPRPMAVNGSVAPIGMRVASAGEAAEAVAAGAAVLVVSPDLVNEIAAIGAGGSTVGRRLDQAAERFGSHAAIVDHHGGTTLNYRTLADRAKRLAHGLLTRVAPGETIAIAARNLLQWVEVFYGAAYAGVRLVHVNPSLRGDELRHILTKSRVSLLFCEPSVQPAIADARTQGVSLEEVVDVTGSAYRSMIGPRSRMPLPDVSDGDVAAIQFTSGTTGLPKGAMLTHRGLTANATASAARLGLDARDRICLPLPLFHCFGSVVGLLAAATTGSTVVLPGPWFDPQVTLDAIRRQHATVIYGVPTMFVAMLEQVTPRIQPRTLRSGLVGGAPVSPALMERIATDLGVEAIGQIYGLTEASPSVTMTSPTDPPEIRFGTVGTPIPGVRIRLSDQDGQPVAEGEPGELWVASDMNMVGYLDEPEATSEVLVDGWLRTGDLATVDGTGRVRIVGRAKEMIIRGGENVYPAEVEAVLDRHPAVRHSAVVGEPSDLLGEEVVAYVEAAAPVEAEELVEHCRQHLASFKVPKEIRFVDELARTPSGKLIKTDLRAAAPSKATPRPRLQLPLLDLSVPGAADVPTPPSRHAPPVMERSTGWRHRRGPGWRPRARVLAPLDVGLVSTSVSSEIDGPRPGWIRPGRPRWN